MAKTKPCHLLPRPRITHLTALLVFSLIPLTFTLEKRQVRKGREKLAYQEVNRLNDVQEHFVLPVLDALRAPGHSIGDSGRGARGPGFQLVAFLSDVPMGPPTQL